MTGLERDNSDEEDSMTISEALLSEFDQEMEKTRKTLERIPSDKGDYAPHEKSMPMSKLAAQKSLERIERMRRLRGATQSLVAKLIRCSSITYLLAWRRSQRSDTFLENLLL